MLVLTLMCFSLFDLTRLTLHVLGWDNRTDGLRAQVMWSTDYGRSGTCPIPAGSDSRDRNDNVRENGGIRFQLNVIDTQTGEVVWAVYEDTTT